MRQLLKIFSILMTFLCMCGTVLAEAPVFHDQIVMEPVFRWSTCGMGDKIPCKEFSTPNEAYSLITGTQSTDCGPAISGGFGFVGTLVDGRQEISWQTVYKINYPACNTLYTSTWTAPLVWDCLDGFTMQSWTGGESVLNLACTKPAPKRTYCLGCDLRSMLSGNPVSIADGTKQQTETDLPALTRHGLSFTRSYRSDIPGFSSEYSSAGFSVGPGTHNQKAMCGGYNNGNAYGCAAFFTLSEDSYVYSSASRPYAQFWQAGGSDLNQPIGVLEKIIQRNSGGSLVRTPDNAIEQFSAAGVLLSRTFADGVSHSLTYSDANTPASIALVSGMLIGVKDSFGRKLQFTYNNIAQLSTLTDQSGAKYTYTAKLGNITQVQYPDSTTRQYKYNEASNITSGSFPNALTGIIDEQGKRYANFGYNGDGTARFTEHAGGVEHHDTQINSVTLPSGETRAYTIATFGQYTTPQQVNRTCSGCQSTNTAYTLDGYGNALSIDDYAGHRTCFAYDTARTLETARVEGLSNATSCSSVIGADATLPAGSRKITTTWHPDWRLPAKVAEPGQITTNTYNDQGAACAPSMATLPDGKPIAVLCKKTIQATADVDGRQGFNAAPQSGVTAQSWNYTYNAFGQVLTATDSLSRTTIYTYFADTNVDHTIGDLQTVKTPTGQVTQFIKYNPYGQVLRSIDANNDATDYTYDARQHLTSISKASQTTTYAYWPTGLLKQVKLPNTTTINYTYDDAHRLTGMADSLGNTITYTLDNAGNSTVDASKDPSGTLQRQSSRAIDALNRIQQTTGQ